MIRARYLAERAERSIGYAFFAALIADVSAHPVVRWLEDLRDLGAAVTVGNTRCELRWERLEIVCIGDADRIGRVRAFEGLRVTHDGRVIEDKAQETFRGDVPWKDLARAPLRLDASALAELSARVEKALKPGLQKICKKGKEADAYMPADIGLARTTLSRIIAASVASK